MRYEYEKKRPGDEAGPSVYIAGKSAANADERSVDRGGFASLGGDALRVVRADALLAGGGAGGLAGRALVAHAGLVIGAARLGGHVADAAADVAARAV